MRRAGLEDFVAAQAGVWPQVQAELAAGAKSSHWMWFVFPQLAGLGRSGAAQFYGLASLEAARDYLAHPVLGPRLREAVGLMLRHKGRRAEVILGSVDAMKFRSSLTLFREADPGEPLFTRALNAFYRDVPCERTLAMLSGGPEPA